VLLVISDPSDSHLPFLLPRLEDRGVDHACLDTADLPSRVALELGVAARSTVRGTVRGCDRSWKSRTSPRCGTAGPPLLARRRIEPAA